jgi:transposase
MGDNIIMKRSKVAETAKQANVLQKYLEGKTSRKEAAEALSLSERQVTRKSHAMKEQGASSLIHGNTGRASGRALPPETKEAILRLRRDEIYKGCNVSHFRDILRDDHNLLISYSALCQLLKVNGLKVLNRTAQSAAKGTAPESAELGRASFYRLTPRHMSGLTMALSTRCMAR